MKLSISKKLFIYFILPGFLFFSFFIFFSINNTERIMYDLHEANFSEQISESASLASTLFAETRNIVKNTAFIIENIQNLSQNDLHNLLIQTIKHRRFIFGSTIAFAPDVLRENKNSFSPFVYKTSNGFKSINLAFDYTDDKYDWYNIPKKTGKPYWTEPYLSVVLKDVKLVSYSVPMYRDNKFLGVITVDFALEPLNKILGKYFDYKTVQFSIISKNGVYISHPDPSKIYYATLFDSTTTGIQHKLLGKYKQSIIAGESGFHKSRDPITNKIVWGFYAPIPTSDWRIVVYVNEEELNGPIKEVFLKSLIIFAAAIIFVFFVFILIVRKGVKPLRKLQDFSKQIKDGNYDAKIEIKTNDEISDLADDLNIMNKQLYEKDIAQKQLFHEVEERVKELKCLYKVSLLTENTKKDFKNVLQNIVKIIPSGWQYPNDTCAKIEFVDMILKTSNYKETEWVQKADIISENSIIGKIEVFYLDEKPIMDIGPFMKEEKNLIEDIARSIVNFYSRKKNEENLIKYNAQLEQKVEERTTELQNAKEATDGIIDNSPLPIAITKRIDGTVLRANIAMAEFHKISLKELYKTTTPEWYWDTDKRKTIINKLKNEGKITNYELEVKRFGNNEKRWVLVSILPIKYLGKAAFIVEMSDVTEIKEANIKINSQNIKISERNRYISDSINYAKKIQNSILPNEKYFKNLFPNYFLIFKPKDVVSGDFYWVSQVGNKKIVAAVDCTGHGVPGALMSMIGNTLLNEIVVFGKTTNPADILNKLNKRIIEELNKDVNQTTYDGMDVAICVIDDEKKILEYSGAYRPLSYFKDGKYFEIKGDRKSIGEVKKGKVKYSTKKVELNESVVFYLYSDGYVDQHNSINKKIGSKRFKKLLENIHTNNLDEQREILINELESHKGSEVQRDDVTILGIKPILSLQNTTNKILFEYGGEFLHSKIVELSEEIEKIILENFDKKITRRVNFCGNELMQNISFYSEEKNKSGIGQFSIEYEQSQNRIVLISESSSTYEKIKEFTERIDKYNSLNKDELKALYKEKLKSETHEGSKGAGIGVLQILRKTKNKINYIVNKKNDNLSLITLKIYISLN